VVAVSLVAAEETSNVIATVNGSQITNENFEIYGEKRVGVPTGDGFPDKKRKELIEELVNRELIYQDAVKEGLDKHEYVLLEIEEQIRNIVTRVRINKLLEDNPPSNTMKRSIYRAQIVDPASTEYKARHILSEAEDTAKAIIIELGKGADFATLATEKSIGPSAVDGGDLGWFAPNQMVKPFSDALEKLDPGQYTQRPVKTRFGWHVIKLDDARQVEPPTFESVEAQILKVAQNQVISNYLKKLRDAATIEVK